MRKLLSATALALVLTVSGVAYAHDEDHGKNDHQKPHHFMEQTLSRLPKEDADAFRATMKEAHEKNKGLFEKMHQLRDEQRALLTAPEFDKDAWLAKNQELMKFRKEAHKEMRENMHEAFATALGNLSQDERKTVAVAMEKMHHDHHMHHEHHVG